MRKLLSFLFVLVSPGFAAITNVRATDATPRELILRYVAPTPAACTIEVSESPAYAPLVPDVDTALFAGSNSDFRNGFQGRERMFIIGAAGTGINYAPFASTGFKVSRALQTNTLHYYRLSCNADVATGTFRTSNIAPGDTHGVDPVPIDPAHLGDTAWPYLKPDASAPVVDPVTGVLIQQMWNYENNIGGGDYNGPSTFNSVVDPNATWTNAANSRIVDGLVATYSGSANDPLYLVGNDSVFLNLTVYVNGYVDNVTTTLEACLVVDGVNCYGPWIPFALPVGSGASAFARLGDVNPYDGSPSLYNTAAPTPTPMLISWTGPNKPYPPAANNHRGSASNVGNIITSASTNEPGFDYRWAVGTRIVYAGANYTLTSVIDALRITVTPTPPTNTSGAWDALTMFVKMRKSSAGGTVNIDAVQFQATGYVYQANDAGSGGNRACTLGTYPQGFRIGQDRSSSASAATNTSPIVITTTSPHDYVTGDVVKIRDVPGNTAANGTWTVTVTGTRTFSLNGSTGNGDFPSDATLQEVIYNGGGGLVWKLTAPRGYLCHMVNSDSGHELYWINTTVTPKDIQYLGPLYTQTVGSDDGGIVKTAFGIISEEDPEVPTLYNVYLQSGIQKLWKGVYIGSTVTGMFRRTRWVPNARQSPHIGIWRMSNLTPTESVSDKLAAFNSEATGLIVAFKNSPKPGLLAFSATKGIQNSLGWIGIYDVVNNQVIALMNTWKNSNGRWAGLHTPFAWEGADQYSWVPYNLSGKEGEQGPTSFTGPYRMTLTSGNMSTTLTDCATQIAALGQTNVLGITGNFCSTVAVASLQPTTPAAASPANDTLNNQALRVGDLMKMNDQAAGNTPRPWGNIEEEIMKILAIKTATNQMVVYRGWAGYDNAEFFPVTTHANGNYFWMFSSSIPRWWNYIEAPNGETGADPYSQNLNGNRTDNDFPDASHYFTRNGLTVSDGGGLSGVSVAGKACPPETGSPYSATYGYRNAPWPNHIRPALSAYGCTQGNPAFDDAYGLGSGNYLEKHPSPVDLFPGNESWFDFRPYATQPEFGDLGNPAVNQATTKVAGATYIYKTVRSGITGGVPDEKRSPLYIMIGRRTSYDVSAAGFILPDTGAYNYTHCITHVAGECWAGSAVGDLYTNAPYVTAMPSGTYDGQYKCINKQQVWSYSNYSLNDICVTQQPPYVDYAVQYSATHDPFNTGARRITAGLRFPRTSGLTENNPATPRGDGLFSGSVINDGALPGLLMPNVPPYPGQQPGINRGSFIPIPVTLASVPAGTNNVLVEFGYNPGLRCSTRQESCIANASSIQSGSSVYFYAADTYSGLSCASGCTPVIPALSQRMMWYRVKYRNAANVVIKTGEASVIATP